MANLNQFSCDAGTFTIDEAIAGQTPLAMYDSLKQAALLPALRQVRSGMGAQVIMPFDEKSPEALFSQMQAVWSTENRTVPAREFYWLQYDSYDTLTFVVNKSGSGVPNAGVAVTVDINSLTSISQSGNYTKPVAGYYAYIKELNLQKILISTVTKANDTVELTPINNEVLDLTKYGTYTIVIDPLRHYTLGDTNDIQTKGLVSNPPLMWKAYAQKFEDGFSINQDEIDGYVYDREFKVIKGLNSNNQVVEYWYSPAIQGQLESMIRDNKNLNTLFGKRDFTNNKGTDGIVPTAEKYGMFNAGYDIFSNVSLKQIIWSMIKTLRRVNGSNSYMLCHDFQFKMDWSDAIADLVKASQQSFQYSLFGPGGTGVRDFSYFEFSRFEAYGYEFVPYQLDIMDARRYGNLKEGFSLMMPNAKFKDQKGDMVPFLTYAHLEGAEPAKVDNIWSYDFRKQGGRVLKTFVSTTYGIEIHGATKLGILQKTSNQ